MPRFVAKPLPPQNKCYQNITYLGSILADNSKSGTVYPESRVRDITKVYCLASMAKSILTG